MKKQEEPSYSFERTQKVYTHKIRFRAVIRHFRLLAQGIQIEFPDSLKLSKGLDAKARFVKRSALVFLAILVAFSAHYSFAYGKNPVQMVQEFATPKEPSADSNGSISEDKNKEKDKEEFVAEPHKPAYIAKEGAAYSAPVPPRKMKEVVVQTHFVPMTAYSSTPDQTDGSPFITASGTRTRDGVVAANFLPIGTKVRVPKLYGDKVFTVEDRMNRRYWKKMDIWMPTRSEALRFGVKYAEIEVVEEK